MDLNKFKQFAKLILLFGIQTIGACSINDESALVFPIPEEESEYIIVFGDLQGYTVKSSTMGPYDHSIRWIEKQLDNGMNVKAILQDGDVSETNAEEEWARFYSSTVGVSSRVPYFTSVGNHDYDRNDRVIIGRNTTRINQYAGFPLTQRNIVSYYESNSLENYVATISIHGREIFLLVLEFAVRKEVLEWAVDFVKKHSDKIFVLMTHEWLTRDLKRMTSAESYAAWQAGACSTYSTPEDIWKALVWPNDNIKCVLCGHAGFAGTLYSENEKGREVPQILFNLQHLENGGNGIIQVWRFGDQTDSVKICAFDTINERWYMPDSTAAAFPFFMK